MAEFRYEITEKIAVISEGANGWTKEVNRVSWNGRDPKLDIREWNHTEGKMSKGITLTDEEAQKLKEALDSAL